MSTSKWELAFENTKLYVFEEFTDVFGWRKDYVRSCKTCNKVTPIKSIVDGQILGNVIQNLCVCNDCGKYFVQDQYQRFAYDKWLGNRERFTEPKKPI